MPARGQGPREHDGMGSSPERATRGLDRPFRAGADFFVLHPFLEKGGATPKSTVSIRQQDRAYFAQATKGKKASTVVLRFDCRSRANSPWACHVKRSKSVPLLPPGGGRKRRKITQSVENAG
jgi:hypothetical protein